MHDEPDYYVIGCRQLDPFGKSDGSTWFGNQAYELMLGAELWVEFFKSDKTYEEFYGEEGFSGVGF